MVSSHRVRDEPHCYFEGHLHTNYASGCGCGVDLPSTQNYDFKIMYNY